MHSMGGSLRTHTAASDEVRSRRRDPCEAWEDPLGQKESFRSVTEHSRNYRCFCRALFLQEYPSGRQSRQAYFTRSFCRDGQQLILKGGRTYGSDDTAL